MLYELIFLVRQDVSQSQVMALAEHFKGRIEEGNGSVPKVEYCGLRNLAYRLKKNKKAHYILLNVESPSQVLDEVERQMRHHEDVLRYLRVSADELDPNPSSLVQTRSYREPGDASREANMDEEILPVEVV